MQKVYLLLRNNEQTGPYSLEELSQLQLKNTDLIWIEGQSAGWYYPYELPDVKPIFDRATAMKKQEPSPVKKAVQQETSPVQPTQANISKPPTPPKKIYVSMPNAPVISKAGAAEPKPVVTETKQVETKKLDEIEQRAEELRRRLQAYPTMKEQAKAAAIQEQQQQKKEVFPPPPPAYELEEVPTYAQQPKPSPIAKKKEEPVLKHRVVEEQHTGNSLQDLYDQTPTYNPGKRRSAPSPVLQYAAVFFMVALLIGAGWWVYNTFSLKENQSESNGQQVANPVQQTTVPATTAGEGTNVANNQLGDTSSSSGTAKVGAAVNTATTAIKGKPLPAKQKNEIQAITSDTKSITDNRTDNGAAMQTATPTTSENPNVPPVVVVKKDNPVSDNNGAQAEQQPEKKGGFFSKLFKKRTKDESAPSQQPTTNAEGERNTTKRDAAPIAAPPAVETNITDQVEVTMNAPEDKWMMGVSGLRLKMYNNSNADLKRAAVDVIYYNEQNDVIERKTVYFTNISAGKSKSVAAPDHKTADHAGYKIVSAVGVQK